MTAVSNQGSVVGRILKLRAENPTEQRILEYLNQNASDVLAEKINAGTKTLAGAVRYATAEAKKLGTHDGCVCVDDATVFGWIIHFFEEDEIAEPKANKTAECRTPNRRIKKADKPKSSTTEDTENTEVETKKPEKPKGPIILELFSCEEMRGTAK